VPSDADDPPPLDVEQRRAADAWFLAHGLPAVLRPGRLVRRLWPRSAPALAAFAVFMVNSAVVVQITGEYTVNIEGEPTRTEWFVLGLLVLVLPLASLVGWLVSRISTVRGRTLAAAVALVVGIAGGIIGGPSHLVLADLIFEAVLIAAILAVTASGLGSILSWTARMTYSHLAAVGSLMIRALPVMLLTFLVFFNSPVWLMAANVSRSRMWIALVFLGLIAAAFVVAVTIDRFKPVIEAPEAAVSNTQLADTPFSAMPDPSETQALRRAERLNVMFVLAVSQLAHILVIAVAIALIFLVLGLIVLSPELLAALTQGRGSSDGTFLGMTIPVPQPLIHVTMFLAALTFMYVSANSAGDGEYRRQFLDPLSDDLRLTLVARNRYRAAVPAR
jgi:MFS family permease